MSGILNNKKRVIDVVLTLEGRKKLSEGELNFHGYTFSDNGTSYKADLASGTVDPGTRIVLEASTNMLSDQITFSSNDDNRVNPFDGEASIQIQDGHLLNFITETTGSATSFSDFLKSQDFEVSASIASYQSITNLKNLRTLSTHDDLFDDTGFAVGNSNVSFTITDNRPLKNSSTWVANVNNEESVFNDQKFLNFQNFRYLPPVNKITDPTVDKTNNTSLKKFKLGTYSSLGKTNQGTMTYSGLKYELDFIEKIGYSRVVKFDPTSKSNSLIMQCFEVGYNQLSKLDVINFGEFVDDNNVRISVFFLGKNYVDDDGNQTYAHIFTVVFS